MTKSPDEDALETLATEWMFHASHFGLVAEIVNGRWTSEQVTDMARGVLALLAELRELRGDKKITTEGEERLRRLRGVVKDIRRKWPEHAPWRYADQVADFSARVTMTDVEVGHLDRGLAVIDKILGASKARSEGEGGAESPPQKAHAPRPEAEASRKDTAMDDHAEGTSVATALESNGSHVTKKNPPSVISGQLRDELIRILKTGDAQNEGAFTIAVAAQVEKFAVAAREILMTESLAQKDLASLMMMRKRPHYFGGPYDLVGGSAFGPETGMPLPIVNNENFGVQAIRQLVDAVRTMGESPAKLVEALAVARSNNLTDVAADLEKKLGVSKDAPVLPNVVPTTGDLQ